MRDYIDNNRLKVRKDDPPTGTIHRVLLVGVALCLLAGAMIWADAAGRLAPAHTLLHQALNPAALPMLQTSGSIGDVVGDFVNFYRLREENAQLRQQISELESELIAREQAMMENAYLHQQLQIEEQQPWRLIGAEVTMRSPDASRRVMTIARGSGDDIRPGMAVVGQTGTGPVALVGIVEEVNQHAATVLLMTDVTSRLSVRVIADGESSLGLVQGQWQQGSRLQLQDIEREEVVQEGAIVVSAGLTGDLAFPLPLASVPADVPLGTIDVANTTTTEQEIELRPYADPDQVRYVWVILDREK
jgi:rod shape-determining protein MreC